MVGTHAEDGSRRRSAQFWDVASIPIKDRPSDTRGCSRPRNLRQSGAAYRLKDNTIRALIFIRLDCLQDLRALRNGVVIRINDLDIRAQFAGHLLGGFRLLDLVIVVVRRKGNQKAQLFHSGSKAPPDSILTVHPAPRVSRGNWCPRFMK